MMWLKACPRCHGDLTAEEDIYGNYVSCLQCGHVLTEDQETELRSWRGRRFTIRILGVKWFPPST